jgi:hypothetical protein
VYLEKRQFDVGLISPFGPRSARPKWRKIVPRAPRAERSFALVEFTLEKVRVRKIIAYRNDERINFISTSSQRRVVRAARDTPLGDSLHAKRVCKPLY